MTIRNLENMAHFVVEYSEPREDRVYDRNGQQEIIATDVYRVLEIFKTDHPDAAVHVVRVLSRHKTVILDDEQPLPVDRLQEGK